MTSFERLNLALRALIEAGVVGGLAYWGVHTGNGAAEKIVFGLGAPLVGFGFWGTVDFHQAGRLAEPLRLMQELAVSGLAALALYVVGQRTLGLTLAALSVLYHALVYVSGGTLLKLRSSLDSRERVLPPGRPEGGGDHVAGPGVMLRGLEKTYRTTAGSVTAVDRVDVEVSAGETVALLGPNGAGKSTTIDLLLGLQQPDAGFVAVFGQAPDAAVATGRIGAMLQSEGLLRDLTVRELVAMVTVLYPRPFDVDETLELAQLTDIAERRTEKLSGGETQRVRFALALTSDPDLLVLDEPTVGMDVEARHVFWLTVREFARRKKTILFATHYLEEADSYADRVVLMTGGRVVADGPPTEIKAMVGSRTIRATLPGVSIESLTALPGVTEAQRHGETIVLVCSNSDTAIRALLDGYPQAHDIEIRGAGLEEAFLQLTTRGGRSS